MTDDAATIEQVRGWLASASSVAVLSGAGISTESGIPDFRGPQGVWTRNPAAERQSSLQHYLEDPDVRRAAWQNRLTSPTWEANPNAAHRALVELERRGSLLALITQNIDGLHQAAGSDPALVIEVHGTMRSTRCWSCGERLPMEETLERVRAGDVDPACRRCGGILKSDTISFGQALDPDTIERASEAAQRAEVFVVLGSSLTVHPAAGLVPLAQRHGARIVIANAQETPYDPLADALLRGELSEVVPAIVG